MAPQAGEPYLKISYAVALGRCDGELILHPDGRFEASAEFDGKVHTREGRLDSVYWDLAVETLEAYRFSEIESVDSHYNTVAPDAPDTDQQFADLRQKDTYVILDGWTYRIDWRHEDGERNYLKASGHLARNNPMIQKLLRDVQFRKRTCGYYFQPLKLG